eukprot:836594-Prorocentrum_minimum.AAC.1
MVASDRVPPPLLMVWEKGRNEQQALEDLCVAVMKNDKEEVGTASPPPHPLHTPSTPPPHP